MTYHGWHYLRIAREAGVRGSTAYRFLTGGWVGVWARRRIREAIDRLDAGKGPSEALMTD